MLIRASPCAIDLADEIAAIEAQLKHLVTKTAPQLLDELGIGVATAAQVLVSWSHPGRCRDEAAFASRNDVV